MEPRSQKDQELFNKIASQYCNKDLSPSSIPARKLRLLQTIKDQAKDLDILEIGCGAGFASQYLKGHYKSYTGIDYSNQLIDYAKAHFQSKDIRFDCSSLEEYQNSSKFDLIFMIGVLHHMPNPQEAIKKSYSLLKPGGSLIVNEPQPNNPLISLLRAVRKKIDSNYSSDQDELEAKYICELYQEAGFKPIETKAQGLFSTPFAEVILKPEFLFKHFCQLTCCIDSLSEKYFQSLIKHLAWNLIVSGQKQT